VPFFFSYQLREEKKKAREEKGTAARAK